MFSFVNVGCLFIFLIAFFEAQHFLNFNKVQVIYFWNFVYCAFVVIAKKSLHTCESQRFMAKISYRRQSFSSYI